MIKRDGLSVGCIYWLIFLLLHCTDFYILIWLSWNINAVSQISWLIVSQIFSQRSSQIVSYKCRICVESRCRLLFSCNLYWEKRNDAFFLSATTYFLWRQFCCTFWSWHLAIVYVNSDLSFGPIWASAHTLQVRRIFNALGIFFSVGLFSPLLGWLLFYIYIF